MKKILLTLSVLLFSPSLFAADDKMDLGLNVYNLLNTVNVNDIYPLTGEPDDPGTYYRNAEIENLPREGGEYSRSYYDRPWYYSSPRETNFFIRFDFN